MSTAFGKFAPQCFRMVFAFLIVSACSQLLGCVRVNSEAVKTLIEAGKEDKGKEQELVKEEQSFQKLKKAIQHQRVKEGFQSSKVANRFGEPVAVLSEGKGERWLYKGRDGERFSAPKIYLFFDESRHFKLWKCIRTDCETSHRNWKQRLVPHFLTKVKSLVP